MGGQLEAVKEKVLSIERDMKYHKEKMSALSLEYEVWTDKLERLEDEMKSEINGGDDARPEINEDTGKD